MNYFTIKDVISLGNGFVLLILDHNYGQGPNVRLPVVGSPSEYVKGSRIEVSVTKLI